MKKEKLIKNINPLFLKGVAHRGLWNEQFTENGIQAFKNAVDNNVAFEYDVHITKDNKVIICHDSELERVTGKPGIIEDLTLKEIKDNYALLDGTKIPTLEEVLKLNDEKVPMVVELKVYKDNFKELAKYTMDELASIKDKKNVFLISFDPRALALTKKFGFMRGLLVCEAHDWTFKLRHMFESLDVEDTLLKRKEYQKYSKNHFVNVWTIEDKKVAEEVLPYVDTITFQKISKDEIKSMLENKN